MMDREAGGEVALDSMGYMWVQDVENGTISKVRPSDFSHDKYRPLSNSEVLDLRRSNPELAFDTHSFETVGNNIIGMKQVQEEIAKVIKDFGKKGAEQFIPQQYVDLAKQVAELGYFKVGDEHTRSLDDLNGFTSLLWQTLGNNARNLINARSALVGQNPLDYLKYMIFADSDEKQTVSFDSTMTKAYGGNGGDGDDAKNLTDRNYVEQVITGDNFEWPTQTKFAIIGKHSDIWANTQNTGLIQSGMDGGQGIGYMPIDKLRNVEVLAQGSNQQTITIGDQQADTTQQAGIIYDDSAMYRVNLPWTTNEKGDIIPDWNTINLIDELRDRIDPDLSKEQIDRQLHQYDKNLYWDEATKTIVCDKSRWFLTFSGIVGSDFVKNIDINSDFFEELTGSEGDMWRKRYIETIKQNGKAAASKPWWDITATRLYKANIFMPITNPLAGSKEFYNKATHMHNMQTQELQEQRAEWQRKKQNGTLNTNWDYGE